MGSPVLAFHRRRVFSSEVETIRVPSGEARSSNGEHRNPDRDDDHRSRRAGWDSQSDPLSLPPIGRREEAAIRHLFLFIGADPNTDWLSRSGVMLDEEGFVRAGTDIHKPLETNPPGVFAIGDVRSGSIKRVAAAVGEGAQVVAALHGFLAEPDDDAELPAHTRRH
jgi:thioredoxin reductase